MRVNVRIYTGTTTGSTSKWQATHTKVIRKGVDHIGRVLDFSVIKTLLCQWLEDNWDHKFLVWEKDPWADVLYQLDRKGLVVTSFNPTAENMVDYLLNVVGPQQLKNTDCMLMSVRVEETRKCSATSEIWV